ncbi:hypothetical protein ACFXG4_26350 [Nocardia sp. NPDC059246]|uniref:hypothetical protein n=1 Tax=unclassified Nocardia TaxID=2637762 RepID=UPI0036BDE348
MPQRGTRTRAIGSRGPRRKNSRVLPPNPRDEGLGALRATMRRHVELAAGRQVPEADDTPGEQPDVEVTSGADAEADDGRDIYPSRDAYTSSGRDPYLGRDAYTSGARAGNSPR